MALLTCTDEPPNITLHGASTDFSSERLLKKAGICCYQCIQKEILSCVHGYQCILAGCDPTPPPSNQYSACTTLKERICILRGWRIFIRQKKISVQSCFSCNPFAERRNHRCTSPWAGIRNCPGKRAQLTSLYNPKHVGIAYGFCALGVSPIRLLLDLRFRCRVFLATFLWTCSFEVVELKKKKLCPMLLIL